MNIKGVPFISVVILNYNGKGIFEDCLRSVLKSDYPDFEVILVDNSSTDDSINWAETLLGTEKHLKIIKNDRNLSYAGGNNIGIRHSNGEYIIILNNDTAVESNWLWEIAFVMGDESIGAAQPKIIVYNSSPARIDYVGGNMDRYGYAEGRGRGQIDKGQFESPEEIFYAGGTAMILRKKVLEEIGIFDDKFRAHWEDTDLSWRIRLRGYRIVIIPKAIIYHKGSSTMKKFERCQDVAWQIRKNRICGLIKNYGMLNLITTLPILLGIYFLVFIKEIVVDKNLKLALSSFSAIVWNIKELPNTLRQRKTVQGIIRRVPDRKISQLMRRGFVAFEFLKEQVCA